MTGMKGARPYDACRDLRLRSRYPCRGLGRAHQNSGSPVGVGAGMQQAKWISDHTRFLHVGDADGLLKVRPRIQCPVPAVLDADEVEDLGWSAEICEISLGAHRV